MNDPQKPFNTRLSAIERAVAADRIIENTCNRLGAQMTQFHDSWRHLIQRNVSMPGSTMKERPEVTLNLPDSFGVLQSDSVIPGDFDIAPERDMLQGLLSPGDIPTDRSETPPHDIISMERYMRGYRVEEVQKYDALVKLGGFTSLYQDYLTNFKLRYAAHWLKRHCGVLGLKAPAYTDMLETVNTYVFGTPYDPRINPLCLKEVALRVASPLYQTDYYELAPGYFKIPYKDAYTWDDPEMHNPQHWNTGTHKFNYFPDMAPYYDALYHAWGYEYSLRDHFVVLSSPGCSPRSTVMAELRKFFVGPAILNPADQITSQSRPMVYKKEKRVHPTRRKRRIPTSANEDLLEKEQLHSWGAKRGEDNFTAWEGVMKHMLIEVAGSGSPFLVSHATASFFDITGKKEHPLMELRRGGIMVDWTSLGFWTRQAVEYSDHNTTSQQVSALQRQFSNANTTCSLPTSSLWKMLKRIVGDWQDFVVPEDPQRMPANYERVFLNLKRAWGLGFPGYLHR